jgi:hypothetical protein
MDVPCLETAGRWEWMNSNQNRENWNWGGFDGKTDGQRPTTLFQLELEIHQLCDNMDLNRSVWWKSIAPLHPSHLPNTASQTIRSNPSDLPSLQRFAATFVIVEAIQSFQQHGRNFDLAPSLLSWVRKHGQAFWTLTILRKIRKVALVKNLYSIWIILHTNRYGRCVAQGNQPEWNPFWEVCLCEWL